MFKIGEIAKRSGLAIETIRFYEKQNLIPETLRTPSGYRLYPEDVLQRILFIQKAKVLGFSLQEIRDLLELSKDIEQPCTQINQKLQDKICSVQQRIQDLQALEKSLLQLHLACDGKVKISQCPIINSLQEA